MENNELEIVQNDEISKGNYDLKTLKKIIFLYTECNYTITDIALKIHGSCNGLYRHWISVALRSQKIPIKNRRAANKEQIIDIATAQQQKAQEIVVQGLNEIQEAVKSGEVSYKKTPGKLLQIAMLGDMAAKQIASIPENEETRPIEMDQELIEDGILERFNNRSDGRAE